MNAIRRRNGASTPLAHSSLKVVITDLLAEYELRHAFRNEGNEAIEAVYSFPVPLDAAFGGMDATLAGETLTAQVMPAKQASRNYDTAISEGDSAVLLEQVEPGMLCVNLGNLKPGEDGEIVLRFSAAMNVSDGTARFSLPFVHRPRYGRSTLDPVVELSNDFAVEHPLDAEIRLRGLLAARPVQCATQGARFAIEEGETVLRLDQAMLDRDLVLNIDLGGQSISHARRIEDGEGSIGVVTFTIPMPQIETPAPRDICLLLDCSGSMEGDAIVQSRQALAAVAGALQEHDRVQVIRFGSSTQSLFRRPLSATPRVKQALNDLVDMVNADLGGTEMDDALQLALQSLGKLDGDKHQKIVILVTDGAVQADDIKSANEKAEALGIRVFVVAVGSSAGVDVLAPLAKATGATLERAVPAEPIDAGVMRQFRRARNVPVSMDIKWGALGVDALPLPIAYPGDAVAAVAMFTDQMPRKVEVSISASAQKIGFVLDEIQAAPGWRAWAGQQAYGHAPKESSTREALALRYGLITPETKAVLVKVRAEDDKVDGLPIVMPVAHMLPEGMVTAVQALIQPTRTWFGDSLNITRAHRAPAADRLGIVIHQERREAAFDDVPFDDDIPLVKVRFEKRRQSVSDDRQDDFVDIPAFLRVSDDQSRSTKARRPPILSSAAKAALAKILVDAYSSDSDKISLEELLSKLDLGLQSEIRVWLEYQGLHVISREVGGKLLQRLLDEGAELELDDDEEAELAILLAQD